MKWKPRASRRQPAFTIVEVMVVIVIMGIIVAGIVMLGLGNSGG
jgi:prepilin-type N-terminal cleavage/methylation domain-containing protein